MAESRDPRCTNVAETGLDLKAYLSSYFLTVQAN